MGYSKVVTLDNLNTVYQDIRNRYDNINALYDVRGDITWDELIALKNVKPGAVYTISDDGGTKRPGSIERYDNVVCIKKIGSTPISVSAWAEYWKEIGGIVAAATPKESGLVTARDQQIGGKKTFVKADVSVEGESGPAEIQVGLEDGRDEFDNLISDTGIVDIKEGSAKGDPEISVIKGDFKTTITSNNITVGSQKGSTITGSLTIASGDTTAGTSNKKNSLGTLDVKTSTTTNTLTILTNDLTVEGLTTATTASLEKLTVEDTAHLKTLNAEGDFATDKTYNMIIKSGGSLETTTANITTINADEAKVGVLNVSSAANVDVTTFNGSTLNVTKGIQATYATTPNLNASEEIRVSKINPDDISLNPGKSNGILNVATKLDVKGTATLEGDLTVTGTSNVGSLTSTGTTTNIKALNVNSHDFIAEDNIKGKGNLGSISNTSSTININTLNLQDGGTQTRYDFTAIGDLNGKGALGSIIGTGTTKDIVELNVNSKKFTANGDLTGKGSLGNISNTTETKNIKDLDVASYKFTATGDLTGKGSLGTINNTSSNNIKITGAIDLGKYTLNSTGNLTVSSGSTLGTLSTNGKLSATSAEVGALIATDQDLTVTGAVDAKSMSVTGSAGKLTAGNVTIGTGGASTTIINGEISTSGAVKANSFEVSVGADYVDRIRVDHELDFGYCYIYENGQYVKPTKYCQKGIIGMHSDTSKMFVGDNSGVFNFNVAVAGFVLAYIDKEYPIGTPLTTGRDGRLTKAGFFARVLHPERIVGTYWRDEQEEEWGFGVKVNGRKWIKVR